MSEQQESPYIEPGLLPVFRMFVFWPLLLAGTFQTVGLAYNGFDFHKYWVQHPFPYIAVFSLTEFFLLYLYLHWKQGMVLLKDKYLPLALVTASIAPFLGLYVQLLVNPTVFQAQSQLPTPVLLYSMIAVLLIAWQYHFRAVLLYCISTVVMELSFVWLSGVAIYKEPKYLSFSFRRILLSVLIGYLVVKLVEAQRKQRHRLEVANEQLKQFNESLEELAISRERNRLARELHDTMAHHMSGMVLQLEGVKLLWERDSEKARELLEQSIGTTREGIQETRRALKALRAQPLEDLGLLGAIREQAHTLAERQGISLQWKAPSSLLPLGSRMEQNLFRIVQEILRNIEQHADANSMTIHIEDTKEELRFRISDAGKGFLLSAQNGDSRFGLVGMKERSEQIGASLEITSSPGEGTDITLCTPRNKQENDQ